MRILVVDDMVTMRKIIKTQLTKLGYTDITEADDGTTAVEAIKIAVSSGQPYDLIISDWNMPNMSGLDLLKAIKSTAEIANTPFLMVTAEAEQKSIIEAIKSGVSNYIVKPFTPDTLQEKIKKIIPNPVK
ncbi:MAG: response regulator [Oligoflexia bacterium]|nr:response regulator [Oligoflexia bacterium]